jgi:two-component system, OmpR family, sensor kinase
MNRSLQRHLSRMLALAILAAGVVAAAASFAFAYFQAQEFQDDTLRQIAALAAGNGPALGRRPPANADAIEGTIDNSDSPVMILRLPLAAGASKPAWLPDDAAAGFHTLSNGDQRMRVFVRDAGQGRRIAVAQATDVRDDSAFDSALRTLVPLVVLLPLLVGIATYIVRAELAPVKHLAERLDNQAAERPEALPDEEVPEEIAGFVHAINRLLARTGVLMAEQRRFIADAAHELRSPLTALSVQAQNLDHAGSLPVMRERVAPLRAGIERARQLTEQLLSLARTQAAESAPAQVDVSRLARDMIGECLPTAEAKGIDMGLDEAAALTVVANPGTLRLILKNALDNAIRYTPSGGEVTLRLTQEGDEAVMEVIDSGPGIPAAERERVFDPFYRITGSAGGGSGLGLAIAREAAARLGGSVSLAEGPGGAGLVFTYRQRRC